ncbi:MAG: MFS transporter [Steroidobacteraceae bacterium]
MNQSIARPLSTQGGAGQIPAGSAPGQAGAEVPWPSPRRAWYAVGVFGLALAINFLDRGILVLLIGPIKQDMQLSDTKASLLVGFAFVFFYLFLGVPIARLVDTKSRRLIVGTGIAIWSLMTALCGLAHSFVQLFVARIGVGVGEACNGPATFSMMSDLFPRDKLPRAISVLNFGFVAGTGLALLLGGAVIHFVSNLGPIELPLLGALRPWQITLLLVSLPGFLVAAMFVTVPEPLRRGRIAGVAAKSIPVAAVIGFMKDNRWAYGPMFLGLACNVVLHFGAAAWVPTFFIRTYGWTAAKAGVLQGIIVICAAPFGLMLGSALSEWLTRRGYADSNMRVTLIAIIGGTPCAILYPLMPTPELAVALLFLQWFFAMLSPGPQNAALQIITPNQMRGQVTALFLFVFNVIGFGAGPTVVALLTDYVFRGENMLRYSLCAAAGVLGPLAAVIVWSGLKGYGESVKRSASWV